MATDDTAAFKRYQIHEPLLTLVDDPADRNATERVERARRSGMVYSEFLGYRRKPGDEHGRRGEHNGRRMRAC